MCRGMCVYAEQEHVTERTYKEGTAVIPTLPQNNPRPGAWSREVTFSQSHRFGFGLWFFSPPETSLKRENFLPSAAVMDLQRGSSPVEYYVRREVLDETSLDEVGQKQMWSTKPSLGERAKESLR